MNLGIRKYSSNRIEKVKKKEEKSIIIIYIVYYKYKIISIEIPLNISNSNGRVRSKKHCGWSIGLDTRSLIMGNQQCTETDMPSE